jgi:hypothetical protein
MTCTAFSRLTAAALFAISANAAAFSSDQPPRFLTVPVLGLRLPLGHLNVDKFPEDLPARCPQIADVGDTSQMWIFGEAKDAAATYFILSAIFKLDSPDPEGNRRLYEIWERGSVFTVQGNKCGGEDAVEDFEHYKPNPENNDDVPNPILRELARDLAARTVRAVGGPDRLRAEIKKQRIDFNELPQYLQEAFAPYF